MQRLYFPASLRHFEPRRVLSLPRLAHSCFAYDLAEALRPGLFVDLGAGTADAFFAVCQSMHDHDVDGLCFAVDPWRDDAVKPEDDEAHSLSVNHHARSYHRGIAYLMKTTASQAVAHFADSSIDLLRVDAIELAVPLEELLEAWMPRLRPGGVLLCPGLRRPDSETALAAFQLIGREHPAWLLDIADGLGVLRRQPAAEASHELLTLLASTDPSDHRDLERFYAHMALHQELRRAVRHHRFNLGRKVAGPS
jgi:hypothetical protein